MEDLLTMAQRADAQPFRGTLLGFVVKRSEERTLRQRQYQFFMQWMQSMLGPDGPEEEDEWDAQIIWQ